MYEKIKELCKQKNISVNKLEQELGFAKGSLCRIDVNKPSIDKLQKIAKYFDVGIEYLTGQENKPKLSEYDKAMLFSGANAVFDEVFGDILKKEQMEELTRRVQEQLPSDFGMPRTTVLAAHFDGNEYTEDELDEIRQFAEFVKNIRK